MASSENCLAGGTAVSWDIPWASLHLTSPGNMGFLPAWQPQTSHVAAHSALRVPAHKAERSCVSADGLSLEVTRPHPGCILLVPGESQARPGFQGRGVRSCLLMAAWQGSHGMVLSLYLECPWGGNSSSAILR